MGLKVLVLAKSFTLLVLIFMGTYFRGCRNDRISQVHTDLLSKCCKNPQNCLKMTEFSKITFSRVQIFANFVRTAKSTKVNTREMVFAVGSENLNLAKSKQWFK